MTAPSPAAAAQRTLSVTPLPSNRPGRVVVAVVGDVDTFTAPLLDACLHSHATRPGIAEVVVDLRRVSYLGGAGVRAMARAEGLCRRRGARLSVRHGAGIVQRTLRAAGFGDLGSVESPVSSRSVAVPERPAS